MYSCYCCPRTLISPCLLSAYGAYDACIIDPTTMQVLAALTAAGVAFCISTTSPKPRVPASITACKLDEYFPPDKASTM